MVGYDDFVPKSSNPPYVGVLIPLIPFIIFNTIDFVAVVVADAFATLFAIAVFNHFVTKTIV
jgi:hypothetical protein